MTYFKILFLGIFALPVHASIDICDQKLDMGAIKGEVISCHENVKFGYDASNKRVSWASYAVNGIKVDGFVSNTGVYSEVDGVALDDQVLSRDYLDKGFDLAYLVAPYSINVSQNVNMLNSMNNHFPISTEDWRGRFADVLWDINQQEKNLAIKKGPYQVITGLHYPTSGPVKPTHLFKIYIHQMYDTTMSLFIPINSSLTNDISRYITSIDCIEKKTSLNLHVGLKRSVESDMENKKARNLDIWAVKDGLINEDVTCDL